MKGRIAVLVLFFLVRPFLFGQDDRHMDVFTPNFQSFPETEIIEHPDLFEYSSEEVRSHPEFGILPHNTQCEDCIELIQERDQYSRLYIKPGTDAMHIFAQSSYTPLHFEDENGRWLSRDFRLTPTEQMGLFRADRQENPTFYNSNENVAGIEVGPFIFEHGSRIGWYWQDSFGNEVALGRADFGTQSIGEHGVLNSNAWPQADLRQVFDEASVETDVVLMNPPNVPVNSSFLIIRDTVELPDGWTVDPMYSNGLISPEGYFSGELKIRNEYGHPFFTWGLVKVYDSKSQGGYGFYQVEQIGKEHVISWLTPIEFLTHANVQYPVVIDPVVSGRDSIGFFVTNQAQVGANMDFTKSTLGSCDYTVTVRVPGHSEIFDTYIDLEYENPSVMCKVNPPPGTTPFCEFFDVTMEVVSPCGVSTGQLICNPAVPPFLGTCTTDPNKVPGAGPIQLQQFVANFMNCIQPSCPDHSLTYTLKNRTLQCNETCDQNCAVGKFFAVTQEALRLEGTMSADRDPICAGEPVTLTAAAQFGVPPYSYDWSDANGPIPDTGAVIVVRPELTTFYAVRIWDVCDSVFVDRDVIINVLPAPDVSVPDTLYLCEGGIQDLGGSPTSSTPGVSYQWTAVNPQPGVTLTQVNSPNAVATVPLGQTGVNRFAIRVTENGANNCFRDDTVTLISLPDPIPQIVPDSTVSICSGDPVTISVQGSYASYQWSTGGAGSSITVTTPGSYSVTVTDANGCTGSNSGINVVEQAPIIFDVEPDTTVDLGSPVALRTDLDLSASNIDSFRWSPPDYLSCETCVDPIASPELPGFYTLTVYSFGCVYQDSCFIDLIFPEDYFIPNMFTPNGDGNNDEFYIYSAGGIEVVELLIYNRWGEKVYDGVDPWNGVYKEVLVPPGVYTYAFTLSLFNGTTAYEKGSVTLVR